MNNIDRAKQFLPFDALKGLKEELKKREEKLLYEDKRIISEEKMLEINETLLGVLSSQDYCVEYYSCGKYKTLTGKIKVIKNTKQIKIADKVINFNDIYNINRL